MLESWELSGTCAGAVDSAASVRCRQRLVVCPTAEYLQVCEAGENAQSRETGASVQ